MNYRHHSRYAAVVVFGLVGGLSASTASVGNPTVVAGTVGLVVAVVYLKVWFPVARVEDPTVSSDDSASRFGLTLR